MDAELLDAGTEGHTEVLAAKLEHVDRARARLKKSDRDLWVACFGCGGNVQLEELTAFLCGRRDLSRRDYDSLAVALNDMFSDLGLARSVPYSADLSPTTAS